MLNGSYNLCGTSTDRYAENAYLESFLIHARIIIDFFRGGQREDDLSCSDFDDRDGERIEAISIDILPELKHKIHKHLAHLTKLRLDEKPLWELLLIKNEINKASIVFLKRCADHYFPNQEELIKVLNSFDE